MALDKNTFMKNNSSAFKILYILSVCVLPVNWNYDILPKAMLYHLAIGTQAANEHIYYSFTMLLVMLDYRPIPYSLFKIYSKNKQRKN